MCHVGWETSLHSWANRDNLGLNRVTLWRRPCFLRHIWLVHLIQIIYLFGGVSFWTILNLDTLQNRSWSAEIDRFPKHHTSGAVSQSTVQKNASQSKIQAFLEIAGNWLHIKYPKITGIEHTFKPPLYKWWLSWPKCLDPQRRDSFQSHGGSPSHHGCLNTKRPNVSRMIWGYPHFRIPPSKSCMQVVIRCYKWGKPVGSPLSVGSLKHQGDPDRDQPATMRRQKRSETAGRKWVPWYWAHSWETAGWWSKKDFFHRNSWRFGFPKP